MSCFDHVEGIGEYPKESLEWEGMSASDLRELLEVEMERVPVDAFERERNGNWRLR